MIQNDDEKRPVRLTEGLAEAIREEYVQGYTDEAGVLQYPSIDALVEKHGVARMTLYRRSKDEDWQAERNSFQTELAEKVKHQRIKEYVDISHRLDDNALRLAQSFMAKVARKLTEDERQLNADPEYEGMSASMLDRLASVVSEAQKIGKLALGEAQEISKVSANVTAPQSFREIVDELEQFASAKSSTGNHTIQ